MVMARGYESVGSSQNLVWALVKEWQERWQESESFAAGHHSAATNSSLAGFVRSWEIWNFFEIY